MGYTSLWSSNEMRNTVVVMCAYYRVTWLVQWFHIGRASRFLWVMALCCFSGPSRSQQGIGHFWILVGSFRALGGAPGHILGRWIFP